MVKQQQPERPITSLIVNLFGPFEVHRSGQRIPDDEWRTTDARLLFAYLVWHGPIHREVLMDTFWPAADPDQAAVHLRNAVRHARAALATSDTPGTTHLIYRSGFYQLHPDATCHTDVEAFEAHLVQARQADDKAVVLECYQAAVGLYRGDFLAGFYSDWVLRERERYQVQYLTALEALARHHLEQKAFTQAVQYSHQLLAVDRCWEGGHQALMEVYARTSRRTAALRQYRELERCLAEELGVAPGRKSRELYAWIVEEG